MTPAPPKQTGRPAPEMKGGDLRLALLSEAGAFHFFGTRYSEKADNRENPPVLLHQVHRDDIRVFDPKQHSSGPLGLEGDAWISNTPDQTLGIVTADCCPILLFDSEKGVAAAIHAGWRGAVLNIVGKTLSKMISYYHCDLRTIVAGVGPTIGPCCFEVQRDVFDAVSKQTKMQDPVLQRSSPRHWHFDLPELNRLQLEEAGLQREQIASIDDCTVCHPERYYSFRRDGRRLGHMLSGIRPSLSS